MRTAILAAVLLIGPTTALAQTYSFADISETMTAEEARQAIVSRGFTFEERDEDGDYWFMGNLMGWEAQVLAFATPDGKIARVVVRLLTPDEDAIPTYEEMRELLAERYGEPHTTVREFQSPYEDGDGSEQEAIRRGMASLATLWMNEEEKNSLGMRVTAQLTVDLSYEYPSWPAEFERRNRNAAQSIF